MRSCYDFRTIMKANHSTDFLCKFLPSKDVMSGGTSAISWGKRLKCMKLLETTFFWKETQERQFFVLGN